MPVNMKKAGLTALISGVVWESVAYQTGLPSCKEAWGDLFNAAQYLSIGEMTSVTMDNFSPYFQGFLSTPEHTLGTLAQPAHYLAVGAATPGVIKRIPGWVGKIKDYFTTEEEKPEDPKAKK